MSAPHYMAFNLAYSPTELSNQTQICIISICQRFTLATHLKLLYQGSPNSSTKARVAAGFGSTNQARTV